MNYLNMPVRSLDAAALDYIHGTRYSRLDPSYDKALRAARMDRILNTVRMDAGPQIDDAEALSAVQLAESVADDNTFYAPADAIA